MKIYICLIARFLIYKQFHFLYPRNEVFYTACLLGLTVLLTVQSNYAQQLTRLTANIITQNNIASKAFLIVFNKMATAIHVNTADFKGVIHVVAGLKSDIKAVTGITTDIQNTKNLVQKLLVIAGSGKRGTIMVSTNYLDS